MQQAGVTESSFKRFMKTKWFRILFLALLSTLSSLILVYMGCFANIFVPIFMFAIPFWLREKSIKRYLINGLVVAVISIFLTTLIFTAAVLSADSRTLDDANVGTVTLSGGTVTPYKASGSTNFRFTVVYKNTATVSASDVNVSVRVYDYGAQSNRSYPMTGNTTGLVLNGWKYYANVPLTEGIYFFGFESQTAGTRTNMTTGLPLIGPLNAPWPSYYWFFLPYWVEGVILPISMYYIIVGLYWWTERARQMRGPTPQRPARIEENGEFECTNCGATVPEDATKCPKCGAIFEEEGPEGRMKGAGEETKLAFEEQEKSWEKQK